MVVAGMTFLGPAKARIIPMNVKINKDVYVDYVLKPLIEKELPLMFPEDMIKVFIHHKATSHTARTTIEYLESMSQKFGISYQKKEDIVVKGADVAPMDFTGFSWLKRRVNMRRARTLKGLCKIIRQEWSMFSVPFCQNAFDSWKRRCRMVVDRQGNHIENVKSLHRKKTSN